MYHRFEWTRRSSVRNNLTKHYEPLQPHLLLALATHYQCEVFLDVGANIGAYALFMTTVPTMETVHAFEPSPETFAELSANVAQNGAAVQLHNKAVSDRPGVLQFGIVNTYSGANSLVGTSIHSRFERKIDVETVRLDDMLADAGRRVCIKIDIEGHEAVALAGMADYLSRNDVILQVEDYSDDGDALSAVLEPLGFRNLFRVGTDRYLSNIAPPLSDRECMAIFEDASERLVQTNLAALEDYYAQGGSPLTLAFGGGLKVEVGGRTATLARTTYRKLRSMLGRS